MPLRVNGEAFSVADSHVQRDAVAVSFEVEGRQSAETRWTELDQEDPKGRYRAKVNGDELVFQRATAPAWAAAVDIMTLRKDGLAFHVPLDLSSVAGFVGAIVDTVDPDLPGVVWPGECFGPSVPPAGYLAIEVAGEENDLVYFPFWRKEE